MNKCFICVMCSLRMEMRRSPSVRRCSIEVVLPPKTDIQRSTRSSVWGSRSYRGWTNDWWQDLSIHAYNITIHADDVERYILYWRPIENHFTHFYLFYNMQQESVTKSYVIIIMIPAIRPYKDPTIVDHHPLDLPIWVFRRFQTELHDSCILYYIILYVKNLRGNLTQYTSPFLMRILRWSVFKRPNVFLVNFNHRVHFFAVFLPSNF